MWNTAIAVHTQPQHHATSHATIKISVKMTIRLERKRNCLIVTYILFATEKWYKLSLEVIIVYAFSSVKVLHTNNKK